MKYIFLIALCVVAASAALDLKEGERCIPEGFAGIPTFGECGLSLVCSRRTMTCIKPLTAYTTKTCEEQKSDAEGSNLLGKFIPRCEPDGSFSSVQCHGSVCYCSHTDGDRIPGFHSAIHESQGMNCNCARHKFAYQKTGMVGKMFRCESNGNYNKIQCTGSSCYCVDEVGKQVGTSVVHISKSESMNC